MTEKQIGYIIIVGLIIALFVLLVIFRWMALEIRRNSPLQYFTLSSDGTVAEIVPDYERDRSTQITLIDMTANGEIIRMV